MDRPTQLRVALLSCAFLSSTGFADTLDESLALVPADVDAAFVVPNLKRASDDLQSCLERADRPETAMLGRPLDLLKAQLGVSVGVRDDGSAVGISRWDADAASPILTLLVPVTDAEAFLRDNFEPGAGGQAAPGEAAGPRTVRRGDGTTLHVAEISDGSRRWVALSPDASGVRGLTVDGARAGVHRAALGAGADRLLRGTEVLAWATGAGVRRAAEARAAAALAEAPAEDAEAIRAGLERLGALQIAATAWDIDALGLIGRGVLRLDPSHPTAALFAGGPARATPSAGLRLGRLPGQPFYLAMGLDVVGLGGPETLRALSDLLPGAATLSPWVDGVDELQVAIYPSKLGVTVGGILNDAAVVVRSASPTARRDAIRAGMQALQGERNGVRRVLVWEADKAVKDAGTADAFELQQTTLPGQAAQAEGDEGSDVVSSMVTSLLLGSRGLHGYMRPFEDRQVLVGTFSQRPDVWRRAVAAATGEGATLGGSKVIEAMRGFAIADPDMELVLGLGQLLKLAQQVAKTFGAEGAVPSVDAGSEPIYAALDVHDHVVEGACVVPSAVVGLMVDRAQPNAGQADPAQP